MVPVAVQEEAARIRQLTTWPRWPWLPMKRVVERDGYRDLDCGMLYADDIDLPGDTPDEAGPIRVFNVHLRQCSRRAAIALSAGVQCPWPIHEIYRTVEDMLADGWRVD